MFVLSISAVGMGTALRSTHSNFRHQKQTQREEIQMKITFIKTLTGALLVAAMLLGTSAKAGALYGGISFNGAATVNNSSGVVTTNLYAATAIATVTTLSGSTMVPGATVIGDSGMFTSVTLGTIAQYLPGSLPWTFESAVNTPLVLGGPLELWTVGGFTFDATAVTLVSQNTDGSFLNIKGNGYATDGSGDKGYGTWTITDTSDGTTVTFGSTNAVPDSGSTALLIAMGAAAVAMGLVAQRRRLVKA